jgi:hypothetical protein
VAKLTGVENLVKRMYSMSEASPVNAALEKQARSVLALSRDGLGAYRYGFLTLVERVITTLRRMSTLQVVSFAEEPVLPSIPSEVPEIGSVITRVAPVPEPVSVRLTRETPSIGAVIRRMIRRLRVPGAPVERPSPPLEKVKVVEEVVTEEGRPRLIPPRPREAVSIPKIRERVVAKVPPLFTHPTEPDEPERLLTRLPEDLKLKETVPPKLERPAPTIPRVRLPEEPWRPTPKVARVSEMGKRVAVLAAARQAAPQVQLQASVVDTMVETRATVRDTIVDRVEGERRRAAPLNWSPVVIEAIGVPAAVREEPKTPSTGVPVPIRALVGFPKVTDTVEPTDSVLERETESRAAQVASQMSQMSKGVAERVAQVYRRGVVEKLPPAERLKGDAVSQAPALDQQQTRRAAAMAVTLQKAEALEGAQRERARELRRLPAMIELTLAGAQIKAASREAGVTFSEALRKMTDGVPKMLAAGARVTGLAPTVEALGAPDSTASIDHVKGIGAAMNHAGSIVTDSFKNMVLDLKDGLVEDHLLDDGLEGLLKDGLTRDHLLDKGLDRLVGDHLLDQDINGFLMDGLIGDHLLDKGLDGLAGDGLLASLHGLMGDRVLERMPLEGVPPIPGMRLHEALPAMTRRAAQQPSTPRRVEPRPRPSFERPKPIEVKLETSLDDIDLKELERRLARILKDEARRYGVY